MLDLRGYVAVVVVVVVAAAMDVVVVVVAGDACYMRNKAYTITCYSTCYELTECEVYMYYMYIYMHCDTAPSY